MQRNFKVFKRIPKLLEDEVYHEFDKHQRLLDSLGASVLYREDPPKMLNQEELERAKQQMSEIKSQIRRELKKPQFYNNPKLKQKIPSEGGNQSGSIFEKAYRQDQIK